VSVDEIVCREFAELATEYLDGAMPGETLELVEEHLAMCDWCRTYLHQIESTARAVAAAVADPDTAPPAPALQPLVGAFRARTRGDARR
jgi:predicted anti-sigma-YlaC factor YlaD